MGKDKLALVQKFQNPLGFIGIFVVALVFFFLGLRHFVPYVSYSNDVVFEADTRDTVWALEEPTYENDMQKHMLYSFVLAPLIDIVQWVLPISEERSMRVVLSAVAALNVTGVFAWLKWQFRKTWLALTFALFYILTFSVMVIYSIPETYVLSNLALLLYIMFFFKLSPVAGWKNHLTLIALAGLASLFNPPLLSLMGIHLLSTFGKIPFHRWVLISIGSMLLGIFIYLGSHLLIYNPGPFFTFIRTYASTWASLSNFLDLESIENVFVSFLMFGFVSPVRYTPENLALRDIQAYLGNPIALILVIVITTWALYSMATAVTKKGELQIRLTSMTTWIVFLILFYVYFNPKETMLYTSQVMAPMTFLMLFAYQEIPVHPKVKPIAMIVILILMGWINIAALYGAIPGILP